MILKALFILLIAAPVHAATCPSFENNLKSIFRNPNATTIEGEKKIAGIVLGLGEKLPEHLEDGFYIYIHDSKGRVVYSPRLPDINDLKTPLASHRALTAKWKKTFPGETFEVLGAGEFEICNGRVSELNNKANTYHGNAQHLAYSEMVLKDKGLKIEANTFKDDYAVKRSPKIDTKVNHSAELREAQLMQKHLANPESAELRKIAKQFAEEVYQKYPGHYAGKPDWDAFQLSENFQLTTQEKIVLDDPYDRIVLSQCAKYFSSGTEFEYQFELMLLNRHWKPSEFMQRLRNTEGVLGPD